MTQKSLLEIVASVDYPRSRHDRRHSLGSLLSLLIVGLLCGSNAVKGCVVFGRHRKALRKRLGFTHANTHPNRPTLVCSKSCALQRYPRRWDNGLRRWPRCAHSAPSVRWWPASMAKHYAAPDSVLNVFIQDWWHLLDMREVAEKKNELSVLNASLDEMLEKYPFIGIFTFDAMFAQHAVVEKLTRNNRMGIFQIKDNQKETRRRLQRWFAALAPQGYQTQSVEKGAIIS